MKLFNGKIVKRVDTSACNCWVFYFTDGTKVEIEVESTGIPNLYGMAARRV